VSNFIDNCDFLAVVSQHLAVWCSFTFYTA